MTARQRGWKAAAGVLGLVTLALLLLRPRPAASRAPGVVAGEVTISEKGLFGTSARGDRSGVVVYLEQVPGAGRTLRGAVVRQHEKTFVPRVTAVAVGASVEFPN